MWQRLYSHYATVAILGMLALAALFHNGLLAGIDLLTEDDISPSQAHRKLLLKVLHVKETLGLASRPPTPFSSPHFHRQMICSSVSI